MKRLFTPVGWAAIGWLITSMILFFLPGSKLPAAGWMADFQVDKWVHLGIFFLLCVLWSRALKIEKGQQFLVLALVAVVYGCVIEWVQHRYVANRSFDVYDVVGDAAGVVVAYLWWRYRKK